MIPYIGDFVEDDIVYLMFNTFSSDDPSASCTITNLITTDVHIHKDDGLTQRCNAAGITVSVNFDGITGSHLIKIDTSDNTVAGFWVTGHDYFVRIEGTTVDAATINAVVGHFSIQNRFMRGTDSANTTVPDAAGVAPTVGEIRTEMEGAGSKLLAIEGYTDKIDDATNGLTAIKAEVEGLAGAAMRGTDGANTTVPDAAGVAPTTAEIKTAIEAAGSSLAQILTDTGELQTDWVNGGRLDLLIDLILGDTSELQGNQANWATATGFSVPNEYDTVIAALQTDLDNPAQYKATGFSTHSASDVKTAIEAAGSHLALILADTNEMELDWKNGGRLDLILDIIAADTTTDIPGLILKYTQLLARSDAAIATDNATELTAINADGGSGAGDFSNQTDGIEALRDRGDAAWTTGGGGAAPTVGQIRAEMEGAGYFLDLIKADTNELQTDWANGGRLDALLDACNTTTPPTAVANAIAVWDRILTGATHNIPTSAGRRVREIGAFAIHSGTAQAGDSHSITVAASASPSDAAYHGIYNRNLIVITDNTGVGQTRTIVDYDAITKVVVVDRDWRISPDVTTEYQIVPDDTPLTVDHGVARGGTNRTITIRTYAASDDDAYLCNIVTIIAGAGRGQARLVDSYDGTNNIVTICGDDWVVTPDTTSVYVMMPYGVACAACMGSEALDEIADCVWDEDLTIHTTSNSAGWFIQKIKSIANFIRIKLL